MSKQWHVQQSTAEQLYEQTPDETVEELGNLDWLTWEWIEGLAQSGSDNPYQQMAIRAIAAALHGDACPADPDTGESCGCGDYEREAEIALTAATPHLRAAWEQEMAEKIRAKFLGPDFGRNPVNGQDSPDAALHAAYDEGLQTALALLEGGDNQ